MLADKLGRFGPTKVLVEVTPAMEEELNVQYAHYLAGELALQANEIHQITFRVAARSQLDRIYGFDDRTIQCAGGDLFEYMAAHAKDRLIQAQEEIAAPTKEFQKAYSEFNLR